MTVTLALATREAELNAFAANFNGGNLVIYSGTPPTNADAALSGNTVLATMPFSSTAFGAATAATPSVITANAITQENASNTGAATFYRAFNSSAACIEQGTVGTTGADLNLNTTALVSGGPVVITSFQRQM